MRVARAAATSSPGTTPAAMATTPDERGVVAIAAGVVPGEAVVAVDHARGPRRGQPARDRVPDVVDPALGARLPALDALDLDVEDVADARPSAPAVLAVRDGRRARRQPLARQRPDDARDATGAAGEDLLERPALVVAGPFIYVSPDGPVPVAHRAGSVDCERRGCVTQVHRAVVPPGDPEDQGDVAVALGRSGGRAPLRVARSEEARAQDLAVAVLEVLALDPPRLRHRRLLPPAQRGRLSQRPRLSLRSRARVNGQGHRVSLVT